MDDFHYIFWLLNKTKKNDSHLYMFVKIISSNDVCVQAQNIVKYLCEFLFSWGINVEQHSTVNGSHCILS